MAQRIIDERTLAGYLISPTEQRAREAGLRNETAFVRYADVEEHAAHPETGVTLRCDLTLRSSERPVLSIEMKRPEVASVDDPALIADAYQKAVSRGLAYFATCNFREFALWETTKGRHQTTPLMRHDLAANLTLSRYAQARREEIAEKWTEVLNAIEPLLHKQYGFTKAGPPPLPPQALELRQAIRLVADEAAPRIREALTDAAFRSIVLTEFSGSSQLRV